MKCTVSWTVGNIYDRLLGVSIMDAECEYGKGLGWCGGEVLTLLGNPA